MNVDSFLGVHEAIERVNGMMIGEKAVTVPWLEKSDA